ncbi:MAG: aminotransferase class IV [Bacteroidota bacterium]
MFIESICVKDGRAPLLSFHQNRMDRTYQYYYKTENPYQLAPYIEEVPTNGTYKLRIVYDRMVRKYNSALYIKPDTATLQVVNTTGADYYFKYSDRSALTELYEKRNKKDDIIIINDGMVSDAYYANLAFWDGEEWHTPQHSLLQGVRRQHLLSTKQIKAKKIVPEEIFFYERVSLINAMLDLEDLIVDIENVYQ